MRVNWSRLARSGALGVVLVAAAIGFAGCGGPDQPEIPTAVTGRPGTASPTGSDDVAAYIEGVRGWVACLRSKGVEVTDPDPTGQVTFPGDAAALKADETFQQAQESCKSLQPAVPESVLNLRKPKLTAEQIETMRRYASCMQTNGAPDFPDPGPDGYPPRDVTWNQTSAGARQAALACANIIGDPTDQPTSRG